MLPGISPLLMADQVQAATTTYSSAGSNSYVVPSYTTLTIEGWGAGGGGSSAYSSGTNGTSGGDTTVDGTGLTQLYAQGGRRALRTSTASSSGGAGGTASGGSVNTTGGAGNDGNASFPSTRPKGGDAPDGLTTSGGNGDTSTSPAQSPGAGGYGSDPENYSSWLYGGGGGAGGYFRKVYTFGALGSPGIGDTLTVVVGDRGDNGGSNSALGGLGRVEIRVA